MSIANLNSQVSNRPVALSNEQVNQMKPKQKIAYLLEQRKDDIAKMLPSTLNAERLLKVATLAVTTTPALLECDVSTLIGAIGQCAQMGLEPNTVLGHAYLVPFNAKRKRPNGSDEWYKAVQVIIGYKGLIDLARRSGQIVSIAAHEVCKNDHFELVYGLEEKLEHKPSMEERGEVIGFYSVAKLVGGGYAFEFMSLNEVKKIQSASKSQNVWKDHFVEMGRKTVIRRLAKYLPLSIEFQTAAALDGMAERGQDQKLNTFEGEFSNVQDGSVPTIEMIPYNEFAAQIEHSKAPEDIQILAQRIRQYDGSAEQDELLELAELRMRTLTTPVVEPKPEPKRRSTQKTKAEPVAEEVIAPKIEPEVKAAPEVKQSEPVEPEGFYQEDAKVIADNPKKLEGLLASLSTLVNANAVENFFKGQSSSLSESDFSQFKKAAQDKKRELTSGDVKAQDSLKVRMENCTDSDELAILSTEIDLMDKAAQPMMWDVYTTCLNALEQ